MTSTTQQSFASILATLTPDQQKFMVEQFQKTKKTTKNTKTKTAHSLFKENCVEEFEEPVVKGWTQVEAPYGGVYASGLVLTKKTRQEFSTARCFAHVVDKIPKRANA